MERARNNCVPKRVLPLVLCFFLTLIAAGSPGIDAGDPNFVLDPNNPNDIDGDLRIVNGRVDIGADEFLDSDGDGLPDFWERKYFGDPNIADPNGDSDEDGLINLDEYELYSSDPNATPYYVDINNAGDTLADGSEAHPFGTIQEGLDVANDGDTVLVVAGIYAGPNNIDLDFGGKSVVLSSMHPNDPSLTIIDCNSEGRGFDFHSGEGPGTAVVGFTIINGQADYGGAIRCEQSSPQIRNCVIANNNDPNHGAGGVYCHLSTLALADCTISNNSPVGIWLEYGGARITGTVEVISNDLVGKNLMLTGPGTLHMQSDVVLDLDNSSIRCNISGPGTIQVDLDSELIIGSYAVVDLGNESGSDGQIQCKGLLRLRDNASLLNAQVNVTRTDFGGNAIIENCIINAEAGAPYGQFFIEDNVRISLNKIESDGDRYLDLDPKEFDVNNIDIDIIDVNITEGVGGIHGGLFELRGAPNLVTSSCDLDEFLCPTDSIPAFDPKTWAINKLELTPGSKLNLTNRFDFHSPYYEGGDDEVLYVKELILRSNSILNTAFNRVYYESLIVQEGAKIVNVPVLGFSLNNIAFDDKNDYITRVKHNNFEHSQEANYNRIHIERLTGEEPDPDGMMKMCNLVDEDPKSSRYGDTLHARAKGLFAKSSEDEMLVWFEYLFKNTAPSTELVVYLSDVPELQNPKDPNHYIEVARLYPPPAGRPGSVGSGRFGVFQKHVSTGWLDFIRGTRIEFELIGPDGTCIHINNWDPQVECDGICLDLNWNDVADGEDFLIVVGEFGESTSPGPDKESRACLDGLFSSDGVVDSFDIMSWDWTIGSLSSHVQNLCFELPLTASAGKTSTPHTNVVSAALVSLPDGLSDLLISGKRGTTGAVDKLEDHFYIFDGQGQYIDDSLPPFNRYNVRLVQDPDGGLYQINVETPLWRIDTSEVTLAPDELTGVLESRYGTSATVYVGIQGKGEDSYGRPILDAAFDNNFTSNGYVYVVPVVVEPVGHEPYLAAAKLDLSGPSYSIIQLFDDPATFNSMDDDNPNLSGLREIEVDSVGNVYIANAHAHNESDMIWRYAPDGSVLNSVNLEHESNVTLPIGMHLSSAENMLYLASSLNPADAGSTKVYGFSTADFSLQRTITVNGMGHVTGITEDPETGSLWVAGFSMAAPPDYPDPDALPFYEPFLAHIPEPNDNVQASSLTGAGDLALPLSIVWTGDQDKCGGADLDERGTVDFNDVAILAQYWLDFNCAESNDCGGADLHPHGDPDGNVGMADLAILCRHWLETGCLD